MMRRALRTAILAVTFILMLSAQASYEAGQRAWEAGRTDEALAQWQAAAGSGDRRAMHALGRAYLRGLGVLQDYVEAHKWLNLAASRGAAAAVAKRDALAEKMTPAQVAQAQELAREWRPSESRVSAASEEPATASASPAAVPVEETLTPTRESPSDAPADQATVDSPVLVEETLTPTRESPSDAAAAQVAGDSPETAEATPPATVLIEETLTPTRESPSDAAAAQATADSPETADAASPAAVLVEETLTPTRLPTSDVSPPPPQTIREGEMFQDCADCPVTVVVTEGSYLMGSPSAEAGRWEDEGPRHRVTIPGPFAVGRYEVTFAEWDACRRGGGCSHSPGDAGWGRGNRPVIDVSWKDAREFVDWLSETTGRRYRLLSEAEWEYAARAGSDTAYSWGEEPGEGHANCSRCGSDWDGTGSRRFSDCFVIPGNPSTEQTG